LRLGRREIARRQHPRRVQLNLLERTAPSREMVAVDSSRRISTRISTQTRNESR
jgi:hypothetical protein